MKKGLLTLGERFFHAYPQLKEDIEAGGVELKVVLSDQPLDRQTVIGLIGEVEIYVMSLEPLDKEIIDAAKNLKYVAKHGAGLDNIDVDYLHRKGIKLSYLPGQNATSVAEMSMALLLAASKNVLKADRTIRAGGWSLLIGSELESKTLGVIGFGQIGQKVAQRALGFGMEVIAYDVCQSEFPQVRFVELEELFQNADCISINCALTDGTRNLINKHTLNMMKPEMILVNTSRGAVISEPDLIEALQINRIRAAALDVFWTEPPCDELIALPNVILTSHIGGSTFECAKRLSALTAENVKRYIHGEELLFPV